MFHEGSLICSHDIHPNLAYDLLYTLTANLRNALARKLVKTRHYLNFFFRLWCSDHAVLHATLF